MNNEEKILAILEKHETLLEKQGAILEKHGAILEKLVSGQQHANQRLDRLEVDVKTVKADILELKASTKRRFDDIEKKIIALSHHQDTDYDTIHAVNKRLDILTAVSHDHEQKFQKLKAI